MCVTVTKMSWSRSRHQSAPNRLTPTASEFSLAGLSSGQQQQQQPDLGLDEDDLVMLLQQPAPPPSPCSPLGGPDHQQPFSWSGGLCNGGGLANGSRPRSKLTPGVSYSRQLEWMRKKKRMNRLRMKEETDPEEEEAAAAADHQEENEVEVEEISQQQRMRRASLPTALHHRHQSEATPTLGAEFLATEAPPLPPVSLTPSSDASLFVSQCTSTSRNTTNIKISDCSESPFVRHCQQVQHNDCPQRKTPPGDRERNFDELLAMFDQDASSAAAAAASLVSQPAVLSVCMTNVVPDQQIHPDPSTASDNNQQTAAPPGQASNSTCKCCRRTYWPPPPLLTPPTTDDGQHFPSSPSSSATMPMMQPPPHLLPTTCLMTSSNLDYDIRSSLPVDTDHSNSTSNVSRFAAASSSESLSSSGPMLSETWTGLGRPPDSSAAVTNTPAVVVTDAAATAASSKEASLSAADKQRQNQQVPTDLSDPQNIQQQQLQQLTTPTSLQQQQPSSSCLSSTCSTSSPSCPTAASTTAAAAATLTAATAAHTHCSTTSSHEEVYGAISRENLVAAAAVAQFNCESANQRSELASSSPLPQQQQGPAVALPATLPVKKRRDPKLTTHQGWGLMGCGGGGGAFHFGASLRKNQKPSFTLRTMCLLITLIACTVTMTNAKICSRDISVRFTTQELKLKLENCTVIEGSLIIAMRELDSSSTNDNSFANISFPNLREVTDYVMLYQTDHITGLATLFPNLAVIRGNNLFKDYALIIYRMPDIEEIGLLGLTHILRGGIRIEKNPKLCYERTVDWLRILKPEYHGNIQIEENNYENNCPGVCPKSCPKRNANENKGLCWNEEHCQIIQVDTCPKSIARVRGSNGDNSVGSEPLEERSCYTTGTGGVMSCSKECLGGCFGSNQDSCFACRNVYWNSTESGHDCMNKCPAPYLLYENWRCITEGECKGVTYTYNAQSIALEAHYKSYQGKCLRDCPVKTEPSQDGDRWTCKPCKESGCPKECTGKHVTSLEDLKSFEGCTKVLGEFGLEVKGGNMVQNLNRYLGKVKIITGSLKIRRSYPIMSLDFFKNLEKIEGLQTEDTANVTKTMYSLEISENENLQKLFPIQPDGSTVRIELRRNSKAKPEKGRAFLHYNPNLCESEIKKMIAVSNLTEPDRQDISYATNGDKAVCSQNRLNLTLEPINGNTILYKFDSYQQTIQNKYKSDYRALLKYEIHYRKIDQALYNARHDPVKRLSKYKDRDACGGDEWSIIDHKPTEPITRNGTVGWDGESDFIDTDPYTHYAVFVKTMITKDLNPVGSSQIEGAESDIKYILTPEGKPTPPQAVKVKHLNHTSVNVTWLPPRRPNGLIEYYEVTWEPIEINIKRIMLRPFCKEGFEIKKETGRDWAGARDKVNDNGVMSKNVTGRVAPDGHCDCTSQCGVGGGGGSGGKSDAGKSRNKDTSISRQEKIEEDMFVNEIINTIHPYNTDRGGPPLPLLLRRRKKRAVNDDVAANGSGGGGDRNTLSTGSSFLNDDDDDEDGNDLLTALSSTTSMPPLLETEEDLAASSGSGGGGGSSSSSPAPPTKKKPVKKSVKVYPPLTHLEITKELKHFTSYNLKIKACLRAKEPLVLPGAGFLGDIAVRECNEFQQEFRTLPKPGADDIQGELRTVGQETQGTGAHSNNETAVANTELTWDPPADPNLLIVYYNLKITTRPDVSESGSVTCVTAKKFLDDGKKYRPFASITNSFYVKVQAVSLSGPGKWTEAKFVSVAYPNNQTSIIVGSVVGGIAILCAIGFVIWFFKFRKKNDIFILSDVYKPPECYIVDEWERDRDRVVVGPQIGAGEYGMVYDGTYNDPDNGIIPCAVKTLRPTIMNDPHHCSNFLVEAQVMKKFNTTHVVKLLGVVSHGSPPLVLMEKMDHGSLKAYLTKLRKKRERLTEKDCLQMALEIADGMAYLSTINKQVSTNKVVHCDLAARNCLVGEPRVIKIADFGMAHEVYQDYYQQGNTRMLPVRWMAPECLHNGRFTVATDVWSFGVVVWEIMTYGETPFHGMNNEIVMHHIKGGGVLTRPNHCPETIHELMQMCWITDVKHRPNFLDLCHKIMEMLNGETTERFLRDSFITSPQGKDIYESQLNGDDDDDDDVTGADMSGGGGDNPSDVTPEVSGGIGLNLTANNREDGTESDELLVRRNNGNGSNSNGGTKTGTAAAATSAGGLPLLDNGGVAMRGSSALAATEGGVPMSDFLNMVQRGNVSAPPTQLDTAPTPPSGSGVARDSSGATDPASVAYRRQNSNNNPYGPVSWVRLGVSRARRLFFQPPSSLPSSHPPPPPRSSQSSNNGGSGGAAVVADSNNPSSPHVAAVAALGSPGSNQPSNA